MNSVTIKKLEFDRVVAYASRFCMSAMGRDRLLGAEPFGERELLVRELERVLELRNLLQEEIPLPFSFLPDTRPHLKKLEVLESSLEPEELQDIYHLLFSSGALRKFIFTLRERYPLLNECTLAIWLEKSLQSAIRRVLDEQGRVRDSASEGLQMIRRELGESRELLRRKMERHLRRCQDEGWLMDDTIAIKNGRLTLGLRVEYKYKLPGYIQDYSGSGQTVFIEPAETLEVSNRIQDMEIGERREIVRILKELSALIRLELQNLRHNESVLAEFDALYGRARLAVETRSLLPAISAAQELRIVRGFHPWLMISHRNSEVIPLDLELAADEHVLVISGPNAGGKSVAMKTAGLLSAMLAYGYLLPCSESSVLPLFGDIFIEIGDDQSIENDLSTFSSHLGEIRTILDSATGRDLVLIDELCAGTDVEEGGAIARAVIEELLSRSTKAIITTHLGELKAYGHEREGVVNGAMEFDRVRLLPTFRFLKGVPGSSFAFAMMQRMGFSASLIDRASSFMKSERLGLDRMLDDLSRQLEASRLLGEALREKLSALEERELALSSAEEALCLKKREERISVSRDLQKELEHARKEIREIVHEARSAPSDEKRVQEARKKLGMKKEAVEKTGSLLRAEAEATLSVDRTIRQGDFVRILDTSTAGEVERVNGESVVVLCGNFRLTTTLRNLEKSSKTELKKMQKEPKGAAGKGAWTAATLDFESTRLDLRGLSGDEAIMKIDRFIDAMRMHRIHSATIIHGKGTGALRQRAAELLQQHRHVRSFRLGEWGEGGAGVTVIELD